LRSRRYCETAVLACCVCSRTLHRLIAATRKEMQNHIPRQCWRAGLSLVCSGTGASSPHPQPDAPRSQRSSCRQRCPVVMATRTGTQRDETASIRPGNASPPCGNCHVGEDGIEQLQRTQPACRTYLHDAGCIRHNQAHSLVCLSLGKGLHDLQTRTQEVRCVSNGCCILQQALL